MIELISSFFGNRPKRLAIDSSLDLDEFVFFTGKSEVDNQKNRDLLLVLLSGPSDQKGFSGAVKLVKAIFLAQYKSKKKYKENTFNYNFYRWDYGPFDSSIYSDLARLRASKLIAETIDDYGVFKEKTYKITPEGKSYLERLSIPSDLQELIQTIAKEVNQKNRDEILKEVYRLADVYSYEMGDTIKMPS